MQKETQQISNPSLGTMLRSAREELTLSQADIAAKLNMNIQVIANLEAENFTALPERIYIRGYIKHYARVVDLHADTLIDIYDEILALGDAEKIEETLEIPHNVSAQAKIPPALPPSSKVDLLDIIAYLTTFVIALIYLVWIQQENVLSTNTMIESDKSVNLTYSPEEYHKHAYSKQ